MSWSLPTVLSARQGSEREPAYRASLELFIRIEILPRGIEIAVPHELLHCHDIASAFEEARRIRVAEFVECGPRDLRILRKLLESSQQVGLPIARLRREDPCASMRKPREKFGKLLRNGNDPFFIVLRREPRLSFPAHAQRGIFRVVQFDIRPGEKAEFLLPESREQERGKDRFFELIADSEEPVQFILPVGRGTALGFELRILERLELCTRVRNGQVPLANKELEEGAEHGKLEIDGAGCDTSVRVLVARFSGADRLVIVDIGARDGVNEQLAPENALRVIEHVRVAPHRARLVR